MSNEVKTEFIEEKTMYGKNGVRVLQHRREGKVHHIKEVEVNTELSLSSKKDYIDGDNNDVVPTDTQKNTVYALVREKGIRTIEQFGMDLCKHFLETHSQVHTVNVYIEEAPWRRLDHTGREHVHAFILNPEAIRFCQVTQRRYGKPCVSAGLKGMKVLKTTKSGFVGFARDKYTTLPEVTDRFFCTTVYSKWTYDELLGLDFDRAVETVKAIILDNFAGPPDTGVYSPSVQNTMYLAQKQSFQKVPQISEIEIVMPNSHYFTIDLSKFGMENKDEVMLPAEKPAGNIKLSMKRHPKSKL
ncbi:uricase-like [Saccoglossus kowalevskii]|uniref:Uricase n=1 Tax=Saccoglossus kowalevskii TaxID=10224 RepID=A0ABM0GYM9_SACKO|nr:PREDICTED: uricase-like [Saccoglossus kowalevskii]